MHRNDKQGIQKSLSTWSSERKRVITPPALTLVAKSAICQSANNNQRALSSPPQARAGRTEPHLRKPAEERARQPLSSPPLPQRILRCENLERRGAAERTAQLRDVHLRAVVQTSVKALENALRNDHQRAMRATTRGIIAGATVGRRRT